jgi:hypothetical protein
MEKFAYILVDCLSYPQETNFVAAFVVAIEIYTLAMISSLVGKMYQEVVAVG